MRPLPALLSLPEFNNELSIPYMGVNGVCWGVDQSCIDLLMDMSINCEYLHEAALLKVLCVSKSKWCYKYNAIRRISPTYRLVQVGYI